MIFAFWLVAVVLGQDTVGQLDLGDRDREEQLIGDGDAEDGLCPTGADEVEPAVGFECEFDTVLLFDGEEDVALGYGGAAREAGAGADRVEVGQGIGELVLLSTGFRADQVDFGDTDDIGGSVAGLR